MKIRHVAGVVAVGVALSLSTATAAMAYDHSAGVTGSWAYSASDWAYNVDTKADGDWTRTNWQTAQGRGGVNNTGGYESVESKPAHAFVRAVQACRSRNALPMVCSGWNNQY